MLKKIIIIGLICIFLHNAPLKAQTSFAPLVEKVLPSTVNITVKLQDNVDKANIVNNLLFATSNSHTALGAGFIVRKDGYIVTNRHVIEQSREISVILSDDEIYEASIAGVDYKTDIALLKINPKDELTAVSFGDSNKVKVGDWVVAIGNPFGLGSSVSAGIISAKSRDLGDSQYDDYLQTDAAINQGNSGGPLFNVDGELIGINTAIFSDNGLDSGIGFAVPSNQGKWVIEQLIKNGKIERSWLGIYLKENKFSDGTRSLVINSFADNVSYSGDLQVGDLITRFNDEPILSVRDFSFRISQLPVGSEIKLEIIREGKILEQKLKTMLMPEEKAVISSSDNENDEITADTEYSPFGLLLDDLTVVRVQPGSEAEMKGIKKGDIITKVDNQAALNAKNLSYYLEAAVAERKILRLDLTDTSGDGYFVEFNPSEDNSDVQN